MPAKKKSVKKEKEPQNRNLGGEIKRKPNGQFAKGQSGNPSGTPVGLKKKMTLAKEMLFDALLEADGANGKEGLKEWLNSSFANRREFFKLAFGALPKDLNIEGALDHKKIVLIRNAEAQKEKEESGDTA